MIGFAVPLRALPLNQVKKWSSLISRILGLEMAAKALMFACGIVLVRLMDKQDYAEYTVANAMLGGLALLTSAGLAPAMMSLGGRLVTDRSQMGTLVATATRYRFVLACLLAPIPLAMAVTMLSEIDAQASSIVLILMLLAALLLNQLAASQYRISLQLAGKPIRPQIAAVGGHATRLVLLLLMAWIGIMTTPWALAVALVAEFLWRHFYLRPAASEVYERGRPHSPEMMKSFRTQTFRLLPEALSASITPQVTVFLLAYWGTAESVADVGALGRIALVFSLLAALNNVFMAKLATSPLGQPLLRNTAYVFVFSTAFGLGVLLFVHLFSAHILMILGASYAHLGSELLILCATSVVAIAFGSLRAPLMAKGWTEGLWLFPLVNIGSLALAIPFFDLSSLPSVLSMNLWRQLPPGVLTLALLYVQFTTRNKEMITA